MKCLTITVSVFTIITAIRVPILPLKSNLKSVDAYTIPSTLTYSTNLNENASDVKRAPYVVYLPKIKETSLDNDKEDFNKLKTHTRPSNLKKVLVSDWRPITNPIIIRTDKSIETNTKRAIFNRDYLKKTKRYQDQRKFSLTEPKTVKYNGKGTKRETESVDYSDEEDSDSFVPTQILAQTRQTNNEEHLPEAEDPRLREVIKDTKVHIEYTEDGYEDIGYDHAGEERHEENNEGHQSQSTKPFKTKNYGQLQVDVEKEFDNYEKINHDDTTEEDQDDTPSNNKSKRNTRFTNDIFNIKIDDYLVNVTEKTTATLTTEKYPYYKIKNGKVLNPNSALRYAEDMANIPKKTEGDLSFYKHTGSFKCNQIPLNIDPLPKKQNNATTILAGPRLKNLGDKILCLRNKYFGVNSLDNPLFAETEIEPPQPFEEMRRSKRSLTSDTQLIKKNDLQLEETLPESSPLRLRKRRRKYPVPLQRPIFRADSYLPTPLPPLLMFSPSTVLPKYKTISEVYYKDEILPDEQLNVFADIMNNIKQIRTDLVTADTEFVEDKNTPYEAENQRNGVKIKVPVKKIKIRQSNVNKPLEVSTSTTTTTEKLPTRRRNNYKNHKSNPQVYEEYVNTVKNAKEKGLRKENNKIKQNSNVESETFAESELEEVIGLSPPINELSTLSALHKVPVNNLLSQKILLNTFPVTGMKPPINHHPIMYSDFIINSMRRKNNFHKIYKRSLPRPKYSEISRKNSQQAAESDDDDYVPKRNRNFHYDTVSKQVIYTKPEEEEEEDNGKKTDNKYFEKSIHAVITRTTTTTTSTEAGPSFLDYVQQIKTHKQYQHIMEPTEKPKEITTTPPQQHITLPKNSATPDFLNIVSKLKQNDGYVAIPEKEIKATTKIIPVTEENKDDSRELQIFDITEYLPKQEITVPLVTIDYSKYKTIQRKPVHNISSRYNLEEDSTSDSAVNNSFVEQLTVTKLTTTTTTEAEPTTSRKMRLRTRRRPVATTSQSVESTTAYIPTQHVRRRFRSTTRATTEAIQEAEVQTKRTVTRRLPIRSLKTTQKLPSNHKEVYTPIELVSRKNTSISTQEEKETRPDMSSSQNANNEPYLVEKSNKVYIHTTLPPSVDQLNEEPVKNIKEQLELQPEESSVNKTNIIKDPSKRLYYYVPVK